MIVLSDALRASNLPIYGYSRDTSPFLSRLARNSTVFDHELANYPGTPNSVSQMQTGRLMPPLLMDADYVLASVRAIHRKLFILPRALHSEGYVTGIVSSHPWFNARARLLRYFDSVRIIAAPRGVPYAPFAALMPSVRQFIQAREKDHRPFYLYIHEMDTHAPRLPHRNFERFSGDASFPAAFNRYDDSIAYVDHWTQAIFQELKRAGLIRRTVFVFTADHGEDLHELGPEWWNLGHGSTARRSQLHVPLIIHAPGIPGMPSHYRSLSRHIDLAPTLADLVDPGIDLSAYTFDGRDIAPLLRRGQASDPEAPPSIAYSWRYWGAYTRNAELIYDQWRNSYSLFAVAKGTRNYPTETPVRDAQEKQSLETLLRNARRQQEDRFLNATPSYSQLVSAIIGIPTIRSGAVADAPTYDGSPTDGKWLLEVPLELRCGSRETAPPLELWAPWSPGDYHIYLRLLRPATSATPLRDHFRIEFPGSGNKPRNVDWSQATGPDDLVDLGVQKIGTKLVVRITDPAGGVAIGGFLVRLVKGPHSKPLLNHKLERQLRSLGYVQ